MQDNFYAKDSLKQYKNIVEVGEYTYGQPKILHWGEKATLKIGKFCSIAEGVMIFLGGNHRVDWVTTYPFNVLDEWAAKDIIGHPATKGNVIIGNDVWIGYGATILSGVTIGDGAVIGARAVVTQDIQPYALVVGNPAIMAKKRFNQKKIDQLLKIKWWDWSSEKIKQNVKYLCNTNVDKLLELN